MPKIQNFVRKEIRAWDNNIIEALTIKHDAVEINNTEPDKHQKTESIILINPNEIDNWEFHDRPESELGDIQALANDFIKIGQQQPCVVRPTSIESKFKYELIIGERRWRAAKLAGVDLKIILKENMTDIEAALSQAAENDNRVDLSDYSKGVSFSKLIEEKIIKQKDLIERLGKSKQYVSALLSFSRIPKEILDAVGNWSKVSSATSEHIVRLSKKSQDHVNAILSLSERIGSGKLGWERLNKLVSSKTSKTDRQKTNNRKVLSSNGRHMFTWRTDNNNLPSIHFPKQINDLFSKERINIKEVSNDILKSLETKLKNL